MSRKLSITSTIRNMFRKRSNSLPTLTDQTERDLCDHSDSYNNTNTKIVEYFSVDKNRFVETVVPDHVTILQESKESVQSDRSNQSGQLFNSHNLIEHGYRDTSGFYDNYYRTEYAESLYSNDHELEQEGHIDRFDLDNTSLDSDDTISDYINRYFYYDERSDVYHCFQDHSSKVI